MSAEQDVVSGLVWEQFCDALKRAGQQVLRPEAPADALTRAEGFRYLSRLLRIGLEMHLEFADAEYPGFFAPSNETAKIGADNPDNLYLMARLDGRHDYRISGTRGTVSYLSFGTQKGGYETNGRMEQTGFLDSKELRLDAEGRFEILLSQNPQPGNWLKLDAPSNAVIVRQTFLDRKTERPAQLSIQRVAADTQPTPLSVQRLHAGLGNAAKFVEGTATLFANWAQSYLAHPNQLPPADQALCQRVGGDPNIFYYHSYWKLDAEEALILRVPRIPDCRLWNVQINNWWMESLDYRYHRICINQHSAKLETDGSLLVVLSEKDPGHPNWLQTAGHGEGTMCWRWVGATDPVHPSTQLCRYDELKGLLP